MGRPPADIDMDVRLIGDHPHVIIAPTSHRLARKSRVTLGDLAGETFLMREPGSGTRGLMEQLFETANVRPNIGMAMSSNETIKQAVIAGRHRLHLRPHGGDRTRPTAAGDARRCGPAHRPAMVRSVAQGQGAAAPGPRDAGVSRRPWRAIPATHPRPDSHHPNLGMWQASLNARSDMIALTINAGAKAWYDASNVDQASVDERCIRQALRVR